MAQWLLLLTIFLPWLGATAVFLIGSKRPNLQQTVAVIFAVAAGLAGLGLLPFATSEVAWQVGMGSGFGLFTFVPDSLGTFLTAVATMIGGLAVVFSVDYMKGEEQIGRYYTLVLLFIGAMAGLVLSGSLLAMFIFWEITALCSYALISFYNDDPKAVAGGIKALIITQIGGIGLLAGALLTYAYLGDYQIATLLEQANQLPPAVLQAIAFGFLIGAMAKSAQVPLHTWLPDAMEAPTPVSALIHAATMVNAGVYLLARFYPIFAPVPGWQTAVLLVGLLSALLAAVMALATNDLKRVLAYSTISQLGYMVYAIGAGAIFASQLHLFSHAIFKALLFLAAGAVIHAVGTRDMRQMGGLRGQMPVVTAVFCIGAGALAGLPLLNGFWSKELVLEAGLAYAPWSFWLMVAGAGLTALYTSRMVYMVFFGAARGNEWAHDAPPAMRVSLLVLAVGVLTSWLVMGQFGGWLAETLPTHHLESLSTWELATEVMLAPATWAALTAVLLGAGLWWQRERLSGLTKKLGWWQETAVSGFGFEWINQQTVQMVQGGSAVLQHIQTGQLNWNIVGIVVGLLVILVALFMEV